MLFGPKIKYFNELEINGEHIDDSDNEDFTNDREDQDDDMETVEDEEVEDDVTDFTEDEFDAGDDEPVDDDAEQTGDDVAEDTGDDITDFTEDEFDAGDDEPTDDTEAGGEEGSDESTEGSNTEGEEIENQDSDGNTLADMEKNLFSDLSPQQLAIKNNELLQNYIELYETINTIFDNINKIPKTFDNTRPLSFIADQLVSLKDMVNYVITTTYVTRTYVENMAYYKQALVVLEQLNTMLKALVQKPSK